MSVDITRGYDSFFGPPSEPISICTFLDDTSSLTLPSASDALKHDGWQSLPEDERAAVTAECSRSIAELRTAIEEVWDNPMLSAHLYRIHATAVNAVRSQTDDSTSKGRKRKRLPEPETAEAHPDVRALQEKLDAVSLQCWGLNQESAHLMRTPKHSDFNALKDIKKSGRETLTCDQPVFQSPRSMEGSLTASPVLRESHPHREALVTLTHVVLSSQSLADFVRVIPCDSSEMPNEVVDNEGNVVRHTYENEGHDEEAAARTEEGCILLIEGVAYGDRWPGGDYADKLLSHLQRSPEEKRPQITKSPTSLSETPFASLTLRINQPYWMLHQGNCEHFIVVDQIWLAHPLDPPSGFPLTVHVTPTLGDVCKACAKVPAVLTVVGDIRLGESPCLLCAPCWRNMGLPSEEDVEQVMVVPLVRHRRVWEDGADIHIMESSPQAAAQ